MFMAEAGNYDRDDWQEIIPQTGGVLKDAELWGGKIFAQYEQNATSELKVFDLEGSNCSATWRCRGSAGFSGPEANGTASEIFYGFESFTIPPSIYRYDLEKRDYNALGQGGCAWD